MQGGVMNKLREMCIPDMFDKDKQVEIQLVDDKIFLSIEWLVGKGGLGGVRAESTAISRADAIKMAEEIKTRYE
jgi:hypothetical protein